MIHSLAVIKTARILGIFIPVVGAGVSAMAGLSESSLKVLANTLIRYQDFLIIVHKLSLPSILSCGISKSFYGGPKFERQKTTESEFLGIAGPLAWVNGYSSSEIRVLSWDLSTRSFGYCHGSAELRGESYQISFQHPGRQLWK